MELELSHVTRDFKGSNGTPVLNDVSLCVADGEFVCIVGPSGCGKSTLLGLIAGIVAPGSGTILVGGNPVKGAGPDRMVVFQEPGLFPWLTVAANVEYGLRVRGAPRHDRRERALRVLRMVHLSRFANHYPHQLSGGMKQRAALARALVVEPKVLLMDEPFAALDAQTRMILQEELQRIWLETRTTIVFVTHNLGEAVYLADTVYLMSASPGRLTKRYPIGVERPRSLDDLRLVDIRRSLGLELGAEIEKVMKDELGDDYAAQKLVRPSALGDLGSGI